jgi:hypothetical protein
MAARVASVLLYCAHLLAMAGADVSDALARNIEKLDYPLPGRVHRPRRRQSHRQGGLTWSSRFTSTSNASTRKGGLTCSSRTTRATSTS